MTLLDFETKFAKLGNNCKTKAVDRFNRELIKNHEDVSFLKNIILSKQQYHRTFFQVSLAQCDSIKSRFDFIEDNFDKLQAWWHVDQLSQFVDKDLTFDFALEKAKKYIRSNLLFVRRWAYVMFMPSLVKQNNIASKIFCLLKDDDQYYVQMAEAWLISSLAVYESEITLGI